MRSFSALELAAVIGVGGTLLAVAVPAFVKNLSASKLSEPIDGLDRLAKSAMAYAATHPQELSFPPSAPLTPAQVPRGVRVTDPPDTWSHLTWKSLGPPCVLKDIRECAGFRFDEPHAFSFQFDSGVDPTTHAMSFVARAHGDLDGDGVLSTFEVRGDRPPGQAPRVMPGLFVDREVE